MTSSIGNINFNVTSSWWNPTETAVPEIGTIPTATVQVVSEVVTNASSANKLTKTTELATDLSSSLWKNLPEEATSMLNVTSSWTMFAEKAEADRATTEAAAAVTEAALTEAAVKEAVLNITPPLNNLAEATRYSLSY